MSAVSAILNEAMQAMRADPARAVTLLRTALQTEPQNLDAGLLLSEALRLHRDTKAARAAITPLAAANPRHFGAQRQLGVILAEDSAPLPASLALRKAAELNPAHPTIWRDLADQLALAGDVVGAQGAYLRHGFSPTMDPALAPLAAKLRGGDAEGAEAGLETYLRAHPTDIVALNMLSEAQARGDKTFEAEETMRRVIALAPSFQPTRHALSMLLMGLGRVDDALHEARELVRLEPSNVGSRRALAAVLNSAGEYAEALAIYTKLLTEDPQRATTWSTVGHIEKTLGNSENSIAAYRKSIALAPHLGDAYWGLANLKTVKLTDAEIESLHAQLARKDIGAEDRTAMFYALGKALEQRRDNDAAFAAYAEGAALRANAQRHDANALTAFVEECIARHDANFFADRAGWGDPAPDPIFIVGLPRSGSTLVEQILASHSQVEGTMELPDLVNVTRGFRAKFVDGLQNADRDAVRAMGTSYLKSTSRRRTPGKVFFIDKMPNNWTYVALIQLALPNAKIIDARRHPMACGWSCFKQHFATGQDFSYDLADIGRYYCDYVRLMAHYEAVLPGRVHRVSHELLVTDPEPHIRALLDHCGLPFEDQCLRPHETKRAVHTASAEQVRQPISAKGLDDWRPFEPHLAALKFALGPVLDAYPDAPK
jgi:tetratricopeptide (TPR) repeat protein